jgi:hypothetical protein
MNIFRTEKSSMALQGKYIKLELKRGNRRHFPAVTAVPPQLLEILTNFGILESWFSSTLLLTRNSIKSTL